MTTPAEIREQATEVESQRSWPHEPQELNGKMRQLLDEALAGWEAALEAEKAVVKHVVAERDAALQEVERARSVVVVDRRVESALRDKVERYEDALREIAARDDYGKCVHSMVLSNCASCMAGHMWRIARAALASDPEPTQ